MLDIKVTLSQNLKQKPADESALGFGRIFTDHMFLMDYEQGAGWNNARIVPYGDFAMDPAAMVWSCITARPSSKVPNATAALTATCSSSVPRIIWPA